MKHKLLKELKQSDIFSHLSSLGYLPRWCVLLLDLMTCSLGYWLSIWIGSSLFHYQPTGVVISPIGQYGILIAVQAVCFWLFHTYSGILRYSTFIDTLKVLSSVVVCSMTLLLTNIVWQLANSEKLFMNTALILYIFVTFVLLFCIRVAVKTLSLLPRCGHLVRYPRINCLRFSAISARYASRHSYPTAGGVL